MPWPPLRARTVGRPCRRRPAALRRRPFNSFTCPPTNRGAAITVQSSSCESHRRRIRRIWTWAILIISILLVAAAGMLVLYPRLS